MCVLDMYRYGWMDRRMDCHHPEVTIDPYKKAAILSELLALKQLIYNHGASITEAEYKDEKMS